MTDTKCIGTDKPVTMAKIYTGLAITALILSAAIWLSTHFASKVEVKAKGETTSVISDLKYFPIDDGIKLETRVATLEELYRAMQPKVDNQNDMMIKMLAKQEMILSEIEKLRKDKP